MLNHALVIARKEIVDGLRDTRSLFSSLFYVLMGPLVVLLVSMAIDPGKKPASAEVLRAMLSVFSLVAAFVGGMNIALDTIAGERERQSLLPLLLNPVPRRNVALGKWLAVSFFAIVGMAINLTASGALLLHAGMGAPAAFIAIAALTIAPLPLLAAALELLISTLCRNVKEAHTYLSLAVFAPMGIGMFLVFSPSLSQSWFRLLPVAGQQLQLELLMKGAAPQFAIALPLGCFTLMITALLVLAAANRLERDEIVFGN